MTKLDDILIAPCGPHKFSEKQGTLFWGHTYTYESSDGIKLRSREECDWHYFLSKAGILHTYEPNLARTSYRPDFGIANNFLLEICGMVESPFKKEGDAVRRKDYKAKMAGKRHEFNSLGYNIIEIYSKGIVINGGFVTTDIPSAFSFVAGLVRKHNPGYGCDPKDVVFYKIIAKRSVA